MGGARKSVKTESHNYILSYNILEIPLLEHIKLDIAIIVIFMSRCSKTPKIYIQENKGAAYQSLCFRYMDSAIPLLLKSEISSF